ncbi:MAG: family 20 glycosylhydrolase [Clostridia bacterium]|nr:family 20 glycosylhydrolase [Clostridia bacterium]
MVGILPTPKKYQLEVGCFELKDSLKVFANGKCASRLEFAAKELLSKVKLTFINDIASADIILAEDNKLFRAEEYTVTVEPHIIRCYFSDFLGGRNALSTLSQIIGANKKSRLLPCCVVNDYPDAVFRSFMHDTGRKYIPMAELKAHILLMAKCKMNVLHFHLSEAVGFSMALSDFPELKGVSSEQYAEMEIKELVDYAEALGVDVVPEIDVPGHSNVFTSSHNEIACELYGSEQTQGWTMCVGSDDTYSFLLRLIKSVSRLFKSKYFHLGTDEISMTDEKRLPHPVADWLKCKRCRALMERCGYVSEVDLFYHFLKKAYEIISSIGKKLIIWNDWIDISKSPDLPRDILIEFWRVAAPTRGPHIGCSMQRFLDEGFNVINASYPDTYIDLYVNYDRLCDWNFRRIPASDQNTEGKIIGGDVCAWDVHSHFKHSVPVAIALFSEKLWNEEGSLDKKFLQAASTLLLGSDSINIFDYFKDVICLDDSSSPFLDSIGRAALREALGETEQLDNAERHLVYAYLSYLI